MSLATPGVDTYAFSFLPRDWLIKYLNPIVPLERASPLVPLVGLLVWTHWNSLVVDVFPECIELLDSHWWIAIFAAVGVQDLGAIAEYFFGIKVKEIGSVVCWEPLIEGLVCCILECLHQSSLLLVLCRLCMLVNDRIATDASYLLSFAMKAVIICRLPVDIRFSPLLLLWSPQGANSSSTSSLNRYTIATTPPLQWLCWQW